MAKLQVTRTVRHSEYMFVSCGLRRFVESTDVLLICPKQTDSVRLCELMKRLKQAINEILNLETRFQLPRWEAFRGHDFFNKFGTDSLR